MIQVNRSLITVAPANFRRLLLWLLLANSSTVLAGITFEEVPGPFKEAEAWGASWGDYNNDRCPDLFVNHHREGAAIYKNKGKRIKWLILPLHESETDRHLIGLSG